ncbi:oxaloacetate decarboxylase [Amycolatopsis sp. FDAARGOS 1241]|uniref:isocitrate lyase/PEP mutase family protein n=1 Tax=Amycolatopsis sp. FDAARGOS 1241 TaxID=2778070 RepID=UPI001950A3FE|nr:isocitrate lyase/phosphoenolpyruvate mutase family protein [Amycolatopsis sp. FDAARGOS 1241]QRP43206.1 isocitrate lyase/phosphoenolpyruvate mutase family protein [Amycolatopsis sp. FDAARGOS 1241]
MPNTPNSRRKAFEALLAQPGPLVLPGAYDALSARLVEKAGYRATYLGSFAAAASAFGLPDVGLLTLNEIAEEARRVVDAVDVPVLADAENGFYDVANIWRAVKVFEDAGVAGVHIEDNLGGKHTSAPLGLLPAGKMAQKVRAAVDARTDPDFLVIARSDAAWVEHDLEGCVRRLEAYAAAGADLVFAPAIPAAELKRVRDRIPVPVMVAGDLLDVPGSDEPSSTIAEYGDAGADIVLLWYTVIGAASKNVTAVLDALRGGEDVAGVKHFVTEQHAFEATMGYAEYEQRSARYAVPSGQEAGA